METNINMKARFMRAGDRFMNSKKRTLLLADAWDESANKEI